MPIVLKPYQHENEQFGYLPDYRSRTRSISISATGPSSERAPGSARGETELGRLALSAAVNSRLPAFEGDAFGLLSTKIAFDRDNDLYVLATAVEPWRCCIPRTAD